jgi:nitrogen-specific signal transduction histidine kinase
MRLTRWTGPDGDHVVVEIEDNGKGIPADTLPCILEPFFTSKPQGEGPGLGLDTAWRIVTEEHAGSLEAASEPGQTVFRVMPPITPPGAGVTTSDCD